MSRHYIQDDYLYEGEMNLVETVFRIISLPGRAEPDAPPVNDGSSKG